MLHTQTLSPNKAKNEEHIQNLLQNLAHDLSLSIEKRASTACAVALLKHCEDRKGDALGNKSAHLLNEILKMLLSLISKKDELVGWTRETSTDEERKLQIKIDILNQQISQI